MLQDFPDYIQQISRIIQKYFVSLLFLLFYFPDRESVVMKKIDVEVSTNLHVLSFLRGPKKVV